MSVIDLATARRARAPHWAGECVCLSCRHKWVHVGKIGVHVSLECPECGLPSGVTKNLFGAATGDLELRCECGCEALTAYISEGRKFVRCMACGTNLTDAFYS